MKLRLTCLLYFTFRDLFPLFLSQNLIKEVQFVSLNLNVQSASLPVLTSFPSTVHIHRIVPFPIVPERQCQVFLQGCFLPPHVTNIGASMCHHVVVKVPIVPWVFRKSSQGSEMFASSNVLVRNNGSISPISSIFSHWIYLSYNSPRHYCCQKNRKVRLYQTELTGKTFLITTSKSLFLTWFSFISDPGS